MMIEQTVRTVLGDGLVARVAVTQGSNRDGEPITRIEVVYDDRIGTPSAAAMLRLVDLLSRSWQAADKPGFPILSYIALAEAEGLHAAE